MQTEAFWAGNFGNEYLSRNRVEPASRKEFWASAMEFCTPTTVLEVGCNRGHNLIAIQSIDTSIETAGIDINVAAVNEARSQGVSAEVCSALEVASKFGHRSKDLVFTSGVLIHVDPKELERVMRNIVDTSARYVLAIEYMAAKEEAIDYRGHADKLWRRPFGKLYQDLGMRLISEGEAAGFDQCQYALLEHPGMDLSHGLRGQAD